MTTENSGPGYAGVTVFVGMTFSKVPRCAPAVGGLNDVPERSGEQLENAACL